MITALIPARAGSKRIKDKNIRELNRFPLMSYSILSAIECGWRAVVSTDSGKYGEIARKYGAEVVMRPPEISGDNEGDLSVVLHYLREIEDHPEFLVYLRPTTPFRTQYVLEDAVKTFVEAGSHASALRSVELMGETAYKSFTLDFGYIRALTEDVSRVIKQKEIREMRESYVKPVSELILRVFRNSFAKDYTEHGRARFESEMSVDSINKRLYSGNSRFWVSLKKGVITGVIETKKGSHLAILMVDMEHQKSGTGRALFLTAKQAMSEIITLHSSLNAVDFYRRLEFVVSGVKSEIDGQVYIPMKLNNLEIANRPNHVCPQTYRGNGYIDIIRTSGALAGDLWGDSCIGYVTKRVIELDDEDDWRYAEYVAKRKRLGEVVL